MLLFISSSNIGRRRWKEMNGWEISSLVGCLILVGLMIRRIRRWDERRQACEI